jgi:hypothetical protein
MKLKVVYFGIGDIGSDDSGGSIFCRNQIKRMSADEGIELFVIIASKQEHETGSLSYLNSLGVRGRFIAWRGQPDEHRTLLQKVTQIPYEHFTDDQHHVDEAITDAVVSSGADILFINFLYSVLLCPKAIAVAPKTVLLTANRETELQWEFLKSTRSWYKIPLYAIGLARLWLKERSIFRSMDQIIALAPPDVPKHHNGLYITPYLDPKPHQWKLNSSRTIFFVGNIAYYPNREAIEYIITKLAPAVTTLVSDARFKIIGASSTEVSFHHPSVDFLGKSNAFELEQQFLTCQLFICPVKNSFGLKFKIAEAISYGTPFLASPESMLGVPHLREQPSIPLDNLAQAASNIATLMLDEKSTRDLATSINVRHRQFVETQNNIWSRALTEAL